MAHPELDHLFHYCVTTAQDLLKKHGGFLPFAAKIEVGGQLRAVAVDNGEEHPEPQELLGLCERVLKQFASAGEAQAVALCYDSLASSRRGSDDKQDAIAVALEHSNGECVLVYLPYREVDSTRYTFEEAAAQAGELKFFVPGKRS